VVEVAKDKAKRRKGRGNVRLGGGEELVGRRNESRVIPASSEVVGTWMITERAGSEDVATTEAPLQTGRATRRKEKSPGQKPEADKGHEDL
jgi:hypothetical protein